MVPTACTSHVSGQGAARARSRSKILSAAKALFLEGGYDGVNLERIASRAGVARQTVYNRFGGKEAVFRAVVEHHWASLDLATLPSRFGEGLGSGGDPAEFLRHFSHALLAFIDETDQIAFTRLVIAESSRIPWIAGEFHRLGKAPLLQVLASFLKRLCEAGTISCPSPSTAARQFLGLVQEFVVWPKVMAIDAGRTNIPPTDVVIEEAISTFLSRYGAGARQEAHEPSPLWCPPPRHPV
ncbi:TetR/AcrR family transcriptional regulator [Streptomyces sp. MUM 16J]|uniref:TetR/AcrR family transcriptional regulator n=1 Tax=Streptomyces sp. MUM 16J TaxID=2791988 RepID=UPI001F03C823|nr:TetR/AcrR family transcriptional regulator [Streptomyces sp. MUM 16J]MCH0557258.1 TetR/AcrR family transcriptional regulator [Streptomyces sp. MUM 16J]